MLQAIDDVGLTEDILRFGFNSILPEQRVQPIKSTLLKMRQIINTELKQSS